MRLSAADTCDSNSTGDAWFHHRKLHRLLALAGYAAVRFRTVRVRVGFGPASRRDRLPYLCLEDAALVYGPPGLLRGGARIEVAAPPHPLRLNVAAAHAEVARLERELVRAVHEELQRAYQRRPDPGPLYNGVYVVACTVAADAVGTGADVVLTCRRTEDHRNVFFAVRRFLAYRLRGAVVTCPRDQGDPVAWHHGSWLLVSAPTACMALPQAGGVAVPAEHAELRHTRHPCLRTLYERS